MNQEIVTPAEAAKVADCPTSTLRAWHNRLGLLPRDDDGKWRRYTAAEVLQIRLVVVLTSRGIVAADAVEIANGMKSLAELNMQGLRSYVGIGKRADAPGYEFKEFPSFGAWDAPHKYTDALAWFDDRVFLVVNLGGLATDVWLRLIEVRRESKGA